MIAKCIWNSFSNVDSFNDLASLNAETMVLRALGIPDEWIEEKKRAVVKQLTSRPNSIHARICKSCWAYSPVGDEKCSFCCIVLNPNEDLNLTGIVYARSMFDANRGSMAKYGGLQHALSTRDDVLSAIRPDRQGLGEITSILEDISPWDLENMGLKAPTYGSIPKKAVSERKKPKKSFTDYFRRAFRKAVKNEYDGKGPLCEMYRSTTMEGIICKAKIDALFPLLGKHPESLDYIALTGYIEWPDQM